MVDIATDFGSLDDDWYYLALTEDLGVRVRPTVGARLTAGSGDDLWTVKVVRVDDDLVRFKLVERLATESNDHPQDVPAA